LAALNNKGIALRKLCRWQEAINTLQLGLTIAPKQIELSKNLASFYTLTGYLSKSKLLYKKALNLSPSDLDARHWLNQLLWEQKDPEFLDSYKQAINSTNNANQLMLSLGHKLYLSGEHKEAKEILQKALQIDNNHVPILIKLGVVLRELEEFEFSQQYLTKAISLDNSYLAQEELGISYLCLNQPKEAIKIFDLLINHSPHLQGCLAYKTTALKLLNSAEYDYL
jgi:tetratricopeptide (TPR) repeat protein